MTVALALWMVKPQQDGVLSFALLESKYKYSVWSRHRHRGNSRFFKFQNSPDNTAEITALIEASSFLGIFGLVAWDANSWIYYDSKHAACVCLGTIRAHQCQAGTCVSTIDAESPAQVTVYHTARVRPYSESWTECAGHATTLGTFGLVLDHNLSPRWVRHNFDSII